MKNFHTLFDMVSFVVLYEESTRICTCISKATCSIERFFYRRQDIDDRDGLPGVHVPTGYHRRLCSQD